MSPLGDGARQAPMVRSPLAALTCPELNQPPGSPPGCPSYTPHWPARLPVKSSAKVWCQPGRSPLGIATPEAWVGGGPPGASGAVEPDPLGAGIGSPLASARVHALPRWRGSTGDAASLAAAAPSAHP